MDKLAELMDLTIEPMDGCDGIGQTDNKVNYIYGGCGVDRDSCHPSELARAYHVDADRRLAERRVWLREELSQVDRWRRRSRARLSVSQAELDVLAELNMLDALDSPALQP